MFNNLSFVDFSANVCICSSSFALYKSNFFVVLYINISLTYFIISQIKFDISFPSANVSFTSLIASSILYSKISFIILFTDSNLGIPTSSFTCSFVIISVPSCKHRSNILIASLIAPSAKTEIVFIASSSIFISSCSHI